MKLKKSKSPAVNEEVVANEAATQQPADHTKLVSPEKGRIERIFNPKYPQEYISGLDKIIEKKQYIREFYNEEDL